MAGSKDYYEILAISPQASARAVEEAYWELAHVYHGRRTRAAAKRLRQLNEAYEVLATPHRRHAYDRQREHLNGAHSEDEAPSPGMLARLGGWLLGRPPA